MAASYRLVHAPDGCFARDADGESLFFLDFEPCVNLVRLQLLAAASSDESNADVDRFLLLLVRKGGETVPMRFQAHSDGRHFLLCVLGVVRVDGTARLGVRGVRSATKYGAPTLSVWRVSTVGTGFVNTTGTVGAGLPWMVTCCMVAG